MALDKQVHIYSVDTGAFYYPHERKLHWRLIQTKIRKNAIKEKLDKLLSEKDPEKKTANADKIAMLTRSKKHLNKQVKYIKGQMLPLFERRASNTEKRQLDPSQLVERNVVSLFSSFLTRTFNEPINSTIPSKDLIIVKVFYFDILKDLIYNGFMCDNEEYIYLTSSAGQIRTKKCVFVKKTLWEQYEKTIMCGLTRQSINERGGMNVNKFLSYTALANSATEEWTDFDIDKTIVIPDCELPVIGIVDFIDEVSYEITRQEMPVDVKHTDGCGMILPSLSKKNFMVRLPWCKGLLAVFDFQKFLRETPGASSRIKDIYGVEHDILAEDIQVIFTKSQFKTWDQYESWEQYRAYFKEYHCMAGKCNEEEDRIPFAQINYQMLQTLADITDAEKKTIIAKSLTKLNKLKTLQGMRDAFRMDRDEDNLSNFKRALMAYPALLRDSYTKQTISNIKKSLVKQYRGGRLEVRGKFTFLIPDLYAMCEYWFCGDSAPEGLLHNDEVSCRLFASSPKLDVLRSPHLYMEHFVSPNVATRPEIKEWFITDGIYTSSHSLISKVLQFDVDGDRALVIADPTIISVAERNAQDIVPLFYNMKKAAPVHIDGAAIFNGLQAAYSGGNIGVISNNISKIWNAPDFHEHRDEYMKCIKWLVMENNFVIRD